MDSLPPTLYTWTSFLRNGFYLRALDVCNTGHTTVKLYYNRAGLRAALESKQRKTETNKDSPPCSVVSKSPSFILVLKPESWASLPVFVDPAHSIASLFILPLGQSQSIKRKKNHETHYQQIGYSLILFSLPKFTCYYWIHFSEALGRCFMYFVQRICCTLCSGLIASQLELEVPWLSLLFIPHIKLQRRKS